MKKHLILLSLLLFPILTPAQSRQDWSQEAGLIIGLNKPLQYGLAGDIQLGVTYANFARNGLGFRTGLVYTPEVANLDHSFGIPLAIAWRTPRKSDSDRMMTGLSGAAESVYNGGRGGGMISAFLIDFFSRAEFYAGLTPGYVQGCRSGDHLSGDERSWTERPFPLSLSLDAGMSLDYPIWRFDLKLMPAFHYLLTNNYKIHTEVKIPDMGIDHSSDHYVRWFFTLGAGLVFQF